jgi:hypothetical protein
MLVTMLLCSYNPVVLLFSINLLWFDSSNAPEHEASARSPRDLASVRGRVSGPRRGRHIMAEFFSIVAQAATAVVL